MNSSDLICLHRNKYRDSHISPDTFDRIIYQLIKMTVDVDENIRSTLIKGTVYEMVHMNYSGSEAIELCRRVEERFSELYDESCLCFQLALV